MTHDEKCEAAQKAAAGILSAELTLDPNRRWDIAGTIADAILALTPPPATSEIGADKREHVMPGDPPDIQNTALQWYLGFDFGYPHSVRESNIAVEGFKDGYRAAIRSLSAAPTPEAEQGDTHLLDVLREECWDLRSFNVPTGGDDADVAWRVVGHWQAEPQERLIAEAYSNDPRDAIRLAIAASRSPDTCGYMEWADDAGKGEA